MLTVLTNIRSTKVLRAMPHSDFLPFSNAELDRVKALVSGSGFGIPLNQDIEPSRLRAQLSHATLRFLDWLSSATLKNFISGVSSRILMR